MIGLGANNRTVYLNGVVVPRVKARGRKEHLHDHHRRKRRSPPEGWRPPTSRAFTIVDLFESAVEKVSEVRVLVSGARGELEEETVLYKQAST